MIYAGGAEYRDAVSVVLMCPPWKNFTSGVRMDGKAAPVDLVGIYGESAVVLGKMYFLGQNVFWAIDNLDLPDGCYVKDPGSSFGFNSDGSPLYVMYPMTEERQPEVPGFRYMLLRWLGISRPILLTEPVEGGDVQPLITEDATKHCFVGVRKDKGRRTTMRGVSELAEVIGPGWNVHPIEFDSLGDIYLHLDSGANFIGYVDGKPTWLIDPEAYPTAPFRDAGFEVITPAKGERRIAAFWCQGTVLLWDQKPETIAMLRDRGVTVDSVQLNLHDTGDAGIPCLTNKVWLPKGHRFNLPFFTL